MTGATEHRAALVAAVGSAVLDALTERGIVVDPNVTGAPKARGPGDRSELETRRSRWVSTPESYLGTSAADPAAAMRGIVGGMGAAPGSAEAARSQASEDAARAARIARALILPASDTGTGGTRSGPLESEATQGAAHPAPKVRRTGDAANEIELSEEVTP